MKISKENISESDAGNSGFTLLELLLSLTIIALVLLVLYQAFSVGFRVWERDEGFSEKMFRLEAVLRLLEEDMLQVVPYDMNWEKGHIQLFAGGPNAIFYVTGNGTGAISGAGAGLFFGVLFFNECPEGKGECLYLHKSSRPAQEFVKAVYEFRTGTQLLRQHFDARMHLDDKGIVVLENVEDLNFSYCADRLAPFSGIQRLQKHDLYNEKDLLQEEEWISGQLPGQIRISFVLEEEEYLLHVPVGKGGR